MPSSRKLCRVESGLIYTSLIYKSGDSKQTADDGTKIKVLSLCIPPPCVDLLILLDLCTSLGSQLAQCPKLDGEKEDNHPDGPGGGRENQIAREHGCAGAKQIDAVYQRSDEESLFYQLGRVCRP